VTQPRTRTAAVGVVLPVHNEEDLLAEALEAVDDAFSHIVDLGTDCRTVVILDSCRDASAAISRRWSRELRRRGGPHEAVVARTRLAGVGPARRAGVAAMLRAWSRTDPRHIWLATTDADSRVPERWLAAQLAAHEGGADVWAGRVDVEDWSSFQPATAVAWQASYDREAVPVHGASLGFNAQAYLRAGGFAGVQTGEDRALYRRIVEGGGVACADVDVRVITSGRRQARAPMGFAAVLSALDGAAS
jgi:Glycosyl transferase family 2